MLFIQLALCLLPAALALYERNHQHDVGRSRFRGEHMRRGQVQNEVALAKRDSYNGRATYYDVGLGACGGYNVPSDYIVALNTPQFGSSYPSPQCGKSITISYNGITAVATIADECPGCPYAGLDMSEGLFTHFASTDQGVFQMTWWFNDGSAPAPTTTTSTYQAPTSTYTPPTSTYIPPTTSSTTPTSTYSTTSWTATSFSVTPTSTIATSTMWTNTTSFSASSTAYSTTINTTMSAASTASSPAVTANSTETANITPTVASVASPEPTYADPVLGNLVLFNQGVTYLGNLIVVGGRGR